MPRRTSKRFIRGQNVTEYLILLAGVVVVVMVAMNPKGFVTKGVEQSVNMMLNSVETVATQQCLGTLDDINGKWSGWSSWTACAGCVQTHTRSCTDPSPKCNGAQCRRTDGTYTALGNPVETVSQSCYSGNWVIGSCGPCTGDCGKAEGRCTQPVACNGGCCDPASNPSNSPGGVTIRCSKPPYPDVWSGLGFGSCSASCGPGVASQTTTCSGSCCDALLEPPERRACTDGCCAESLYIGWDIENNVDFMGTFGPAGNGQPAPAAGGCPPGYAGNPTRVCSATASPSCAGNNTYSPPASCYSIAWGGLSGECVPANCDPVTADVGYGGYTLNYDFPYTLHGQTAGVECSTLRQNGVGHTGGTANYDCWLGAWRNLNAPCIPNCPADSVSIGAGLTGAFPETVDGGIANISCASYDEGPGCGPKRYEGAVSRSCSLGTWSGISGSCDYQHCETAFFMDPNAFVQGTFTGPVVHGTPQTVTCDAVDSRYTGDFSRTCDYGQWCSPTGGCTAQSCPAWTTNVNGVDITFTAAAHGSPQTQDCNDFDNNSTGTVSAECSFGNWINLSGGCTAFQCTNPISPSNATMCSGDNANLTADTNWSLVDYNGCSPTKCEYQCNSGYVKSGNDCVLAVCQGGNPDSNGLATMCSGDGNPLVNTPRTLKASCSSPAGSDPKCEYYCPNPYVLYSGACCQPSCPANSCGTQNDGCGGTLNCGPCPCPAPEGGTIAHGTSRTYYQASSVSCGGSCRSESRTCNNGTLSSPTGLNYANTSCSVEVCVNCTGPDGSTIVHGLSKTYYQAISVPCGSTCSSELRICNNGTLSGSYAYNGCSVQACPADDYGPWISAADSSVVLKNLSVCGWAVASGPDTCDGNPFTLYTCSPTSTQSCVDEYLFCFNIGFCNPRCFYIARNITCNVPPPDTCDGNASASYTCPNGVSQTCTDTNGENYRSVTCYP